MKIGVFICHCGSNIAGTVDCAKVAEIACLSLYVSGVHIELQRFIEMTLGALEVAARQQQLGNLNVVILERVVERPH